MATISFNPLVAVDFTSINTTRNVFDVMSSTSYDFDSSTLVDIDMAGTGLVFDGSGNITDGTLTRIDIDLGGDQPAINGGDINISGLNITAAADLGVIDNGAFNLFGVALQGNDTFLLAGLSEDADTPTATNRIFGDDRANIVLFLAGSSNTNTGGDDVFSGADNRLEVAGDVWTHDAGGLGLSSTYTGGRDTYFGTVTEEFNRLAGDAWIVNRSGIGQTTLNGGNDVLDLGGNTSGSSWIAGDVNEMNNGVVNGGDDEITSDDSATPEVAGDVRTYNGGTLNGGDDIISLANSSRTGGDVMFLNAPVPTGVFTLTGGADEITGGGGDDIIGGDVYDRNSTVDNLLVGGDDVIHGGAGDDDLFGEVAFGDALVGVTGGNDVIFGGAGNDELRGQGGDDVLDGGSGNDTIDGGAGIDTLSYATAAAGIAVNILVVGAQNTLGAGIDSILGFENVSGSRYGDTIRGNNVSNELNGAGGNDQLFSGAGEDVLSGGAGNDVLNTAGQKDDVAMGGAGDDTFQASGGGNLLIGNGGLDTVSFSTVAANSTLNLSTGQARQNAGSTVDSLFLVENATGGSLHDTIVGNAVANVLSGLAGNDTIRGGAGNDTIDGGAGNNSLFGDLGDDTLTGGVGEDAMSGGDGADTLNGGDSRDQMTGDAGNDTLNGEGGNDVISGGANNDTLSGGDGADRLNGNDGVDTLTGNAGNDILTGGTGNDFLDGGEGSDTYTGSAGADTMIFGPATGNVLDIIVDFEDDGSIADDLIDVTAYGFASVASITAVASGNDAILAFGGGDRVRLEDYLLTHTLASIGADDFLL